MADSPRIEDLRRRVHQDPASIAFAQLAEEYRRTGDHAEAVRVARAGLAHHPSFLSARVTLGRALMALERYDDAQAELEYVLRAAPDNLSAIRGMAELHQRRGNLHQSLKQFSTALDIARNEILVPKPPARVVDEIPLPPEQPDDEAFRRALASLDALSIDVKMPSLDKLDAFRPETSDRPPRDPVLTDLEAWLDAILIDRERRNLF